MISKKSLTSVIFFFLFVFSFPLYSTIEIDTHSSFTKILFLVCLLFMFLNLNLMIIFLSQNRILNLLLFIFFILSLITFTVKNDSNSFILFSPFFIFVSVAIVTQIRLDLNILIIGILFFYIYYYQIYFSSLPSFVNRKDFGFDEEAMFEGASSNAIPIVLNNLIYIFIILNNYFKSNKIKVILGFSILNLFLIAIQNSRAGLVIAVILFTIIFFELYPGFVAKYTKIVYLMIGFISVLVLQLAIDKIDSNSYTIIEIAQESRGLAQVEFLLSMTFFNFLWGYPEGHTFFLFEYTFNVFLDLWNKSGFIGFVLFVFIFILRFINYKKYHFQLIYFLPFLAYAMVESIYFPKYWDFAIILLLIVPKNYKLMNR
jgi:hypothetical protein